LSRVLNPDVLDIRKHSVLGGGAIFVKVPFELTAHDFLEFAQLDLRGKSERDVINALANIKRSIDCLLDGLLSAMNYLEKSRKERWNFPQKLDFLGEMGIIAPFVLGRINSMRNWLEHEFRRPKRDEVENAFDIASLFFYATSRFTRRFPTDFEIGDENDVIVFTITYDRETHKIIVEDPKGKRIEIGENAKEYVNWLRTFFKIQYLLM